MKHLLLLFCLMVLSGTFYACTSPKDTVTGLIDKTAALAKIDQGKQLIADAKIREALIVFREAALKDPNTWKAPYWIAYCHYRLNNYGYARKYSEEAIEKGKADVDPEAYEILGSSLHRLGAIDSALVNYQIALTKLAPNRAKELNIKGKIENCAYASNELSKGIGKRTQLRGDVNSGFNEYAPILVNNGKVLYFTSRRANTTGGKMNPDDQEYFEDVYRAVWNDKNKMWDSVSNKVDRLNTDGFDALSWISKDGLSGIITHNNNATDAKNQTKSSDICEVTFTNKGKWTVAKPIVNKSINTSFFEGSASLTADGNTMYFVSDRKGDKRSTDIYVVERIGKKWGEALLLSDSVNTIGRETTPYITPDGRFLFFSSDGHTGMGGLDVFVSENTGTGWTKAKNLGASVNTVNNDTHFVLYKDLGKAFISGFNIEGQKSSMDIYEIDLSTIVFPIKM